MARRTLYDEHEAREQLGGIGRTLFYELIGSGQLRSVKLGRRRLVPADAIEELVDRLSQDGPQQRQAGASVA
jgi:excisionase family DNA binding protein